MQAPSLKKLQLFDNLYNELENRLQCNRLQGPKDLSQKIQTGTIKTPERDEFVPSSDFKIQKVHRIKGDLDVKLENYREDPMARAELERRVFQHEKRRMMQSARFSQGHMINFRKINVESLGAEKSDLEKVQLPCRPQTAPTRVLGSRPGMGGSPTARKEYVRHVSARAVLKNIHCRDVHQRRNDHEEFWLSRKVALANRAETRRLEEGERRKKEKENEEKVISERKWMVLTSLCYRMEFIRDQLRKNQMLRAEFTRRKGAAVRIATWFKAILVESRKKDLLNACIKLQKFTAPIMVEKKKRAREACAERLYNFLEQLKDSSQISLAVRRFKQLMVVIQRAWRGFCSVRAAQRLLLSKQFQRFETSLLKYNHKTNKKQPRRSTKRKAAPLSRSMFFHPADVVDPRPSGKKKVCPMNSLGAFENSTNTKGAQLKVKPKDEDKPDYERLLTLAALMMRIPKNIKAQVIDEQLVKETGHFHERLEQHHRDKRVYLTQKPIDEVRLKLLRDAGFKATPQVLPPKVPRLRVLQNVTGLQTMMQRAIQLVQEEQISAQRRNEDNLMQSILNLENL